MANRYIRQFEFTNAADSPACPVALEKGAVLLDTKTNTYYLQLKLANIGAVPVTSVKVCIEAFDSEGDPAYPGQAPGIAAEYNVLVQAGESFGTKQLLPVPNNNAATFRVYIGQVTTNTGYVLDFPREQYTDSTGRDISLERENALAAAREMQAKQAKRYLKMWGAKWYHVLFAAWILVYLIWVL
ncbi:MAG TPA: hypothetical protein VIM13_07490 [Clostridia bacterium]